MPRTTALPLPLVSRALAELGQNVRLARLRRKLTAELVAERAGMSRPTLRALERGEASVTLGALANVLHSLGLEGDLRMVAKDDELGRALQDARLEPPQRARRKKASMRHGDDS
jgi:transcriptional regulator with XRE-family HTH domain